MKIHKRNNENDTVFKKITQRNGDLLNVIRSKNSALLIFHRFQISQHSIPETTKMDLDEQAIIHRTAN